MNSRPVKRIEDVIRLRAAQFSEDNGALLHSVGLFKQTCCQVRAPSGCAQRSPCAVMQRGRDSSASR